MIQGKYAADITGMRSGKAVALERSDVIKRGARLWKCRCDCGNIFYTDAYKIRNGIVKSCGCYRSEFKRKDISGKRYGRLTAIRRLSEKKGSSYLWLCRCDCGKEINASVEDLEAGKYSSCGCAKTERLQAQAKDISGQRFGRLMAVRPLGKRFYGSVVWLCRCDCGNECEVSIGSLIQHNTKSCGCLAKEKPPCSNSHYVEGTCVEALERKTLRSTNTSGYTGVYRRNNGKWYAVIVFKKKRYYLGCFEKIEDAAKARAVAEEKIYGPFLNWYYSVYQEDNQCIADMETEHEDAG